MTKARDIASAAPAPSTVDATELGYLDGVTSAIQTQLDAKTAKSTLTTTGDIYYASAANTPARLGIGTAAQVLQVNSGATAPEWVAAPSSGGMTLISTTTLSGSSITLSSIPSTYINLMVIVKNYRPVNDNTNLVLRVNGDSATRYASGSGSFSGTSWSISGGADNGTSQAFCVTNIYDYTNTVTWKTASALAWTNDDGTPTSVKIQNSPTLAYNQTGAITSLVFLTNSGNFTSGEVLLYGVK